jgi:DNA-binding SARP family transcriptional activator
MLTVRLFGCFAIEHAHCNRVPDVGRNGRRLAAFLFCHPNRSHRREKLMDLFWSDTGPDQARAAFSTALWKIRRALAPSCRETALRANGHIVALDMPQPGIVDAHRFAAETALALSTSQAELLGRAIDLYGGPFLEEFDEHWVLEERERLESLFIRALTLQMRRHAGDGRYEDALVCVRRILAVDPMRETAQRAAMLLYILNGQRGQALRQFQRCRAVLQEECAVEPMPETRSLVTMIRDGAVFERLPALLHETFGDRHEDART